MDENNLLDRFNGKFSFNYKGIEYKITTSCDTKRLNFKYHLHDENGIQVHSFEYTPTRHDLIATLVDLGILRDSEKNNQSLFSMRGHYIQNDYAIDDSNEFTSAELALSAVYSNILDGIYHVHDDVSICYAESGDCSGGDPDDISKSHYQKIELEEYFECEFGGDFPDSRDRILLEYMKYASNLSEKDVKELKKELSPEDISGLFAHVNDHPLHSTSLIARALNNGHPYFAIELLDKNLWDYEELNVHAKGNGGTSPFEGAVNGNHPKIAFEFINHPSFWKIGEDEINSIAAGLDEKYKGMILASVAQRELSSIAQEFKTIRP